jgi:membrane fusion protein, copper/silver efflux system
MDEPRTNERLAPEAAAPARRRYGLASLILIAVLAGGLAAAATFLIVGRSAPHVADRDAQTAAAPAPKKQLYTCPMHPTIVQDHPGECPICGMDLVPMDPEEPAAGAGQESPEGLVPVTIDTTRQQLIGLRTAPVERGRVGAVWRTVGRVAVDETRVRHINIKVGGFVERVFVDFIGKPVAKGQPLFSIYSPDLVAAQEEYLLALRTRGTLGGSLAASGDDLVAASRRKLRLWDIPEAEIARLEKTGEPQKNLTLRSPISGVVVKKDVVEGMQLAAGAMPYEIVDLSTVWVLADVYESELRHVAVGMPAIFTLKAFPNQVFEGRVRFIDPLLDPGTRTVKVRLEFPNPAGDLRPEMFGEVVLKTPAREALRVPADALIHTGTRTVVFVALGEGKFQPREIKVGDSDGQFVEVVEGLSPDEQVVTRANFLIDSESRLRASLAAMREPVPEGTPAPPEPPPAGGHVGH